MQYRCSERRYVPINSGWLSTFVPADGAQSGGGGFRTPRISTYLDWNNDENVITYFSPRFAGFQIGATYAPTVSGSGDGANFPVYANKDTEFHNGISDRRELRQHPRSGRPGRGRRFPLGAGSG